MTEAEMIEGCIREDRACQYALYKAFAGKMLAVCRRYARNDLEAEDILQEGFIKAFDHIKQFRSQGSFQGWIHRIMVNTALNHYRSSSYQKEQIGLDMEYDTPFDAGIIERISGDELIKLIRTLPEGYRMVFNLYAIEGYSHQEISEMLGQTGSTSRTQLAKARKWLQKRVLESQKIEYERK